MNVYQEFADEWERAREIEPGGYSRHPVQAYLAFQRAAGACFIDQFIPRNPLTMGPEGYESDVDRTATTGAGVGGLQDFRCEAGMDYPRICRMTERDGVPLLIMAGASVTHTLPSGTRGDMARVLEWLVENGPERGLFLGASSSISPGTPHENIQTLIDGLACYRGSGRK